MKTLMLLSLLCYVAFPVKHSLKYILTSSYGVRSVPEFVAVAVVDEVLMAHCDINRLKPVAKTDWMEKFFKENEERSKWYTNRCHDNQYHFKATIESLMQRLNQTGELPSVSLLQKSPSSPVSCHATGFYPDRATLIWRKDGVEVHEDVDHGELLPNHDGSFQMSVDLNLSSVTPEDWRRYDCVFHLSGVKDNIVTRLDKAVIRTNWEKPSDMTVPIIAAVVVLVLVLIAAAGFMVYKRKKAKCPPSSPDTGFELPEKPNPEI